MNGLREELKVIPRVGWAIAALMYVAAAVLLLAATWRKPEWQDWTRVALSAGLPFILFLSVLLVAYVNGDARRRGMRRLLWTLLVIFVPNFIGFILYFIMREPLLSDCSRCGAAVKQAFPFCPVCGAAIGPTCPQCGRSVEPGWSHCARCGAALPSAALRVD